MGFLWILKTFQVKRRTQPCHQEGDVQFFFVTVICLYNEI